MRSLWLIPTSIALSLSVVLPSAGLTVSFGGDLTGQPTFDSPSENGTNPPTSTFSDDFGFVVDFPYYSQPFYVDTSGSYDFLSTSNTFTTNALSPPNAANWNNYTVLYVNNFDPNNPLTNAIIVNDNFPTQGSSGFNGINLTANTQYYFVTTVFNPDDGYGTFTNDITGTGQISLGTVPAAVPLEFSHSLGLLIFGGYTAINRFRKQKQRSLLASKSEDKH